MTEGGVLSARLKPPFVPVVESKPLKPSNEPMGAVARALRVWMERAGEGWRGLGQRVGIGADGDRRGG